MFNFTKYFFCVTYIMVILFSVLNQAILWSSCCYPLYAPLDSVCWTFLKECLHLHLWAAAAAAKLLQSCPTLCNPIDGSPPGSAIPGILQARTLEWLPFPSPMHEVKSESEVAQSCPTLHDPMACSLPSSSVHGIFQARVLEWGAIAFSKPPF